MASSSAWPRIRPGRSARSSRKCPNGCATIIARLHAKNPEDRPASAHEVADLLASGLQDRPAEDTPAAIPLRVRPRFARHRWLVAASVFLALLAGLGLAQASGVADLRGLVIRLFSPDGTLVVEVDDPGVSVRIDGSDMVITGTGLKELHVKPALTGWSPARTAGLSSRTSSRSSGTAGA